jgi:alcohol dehydrogenase
LLNRRTYRHRQEALDTLVERLRAWIERLDLPPLGASGVAPDHQDRIVADSRGGGMRKNPLVLTDAELERVLESRM